MGCWNGTDMITHLPILWHDPVRCVVIAHQSHEPGCGGFCYPDNPWLPIGPALRGTYNDYGCIEGIAEGLSADWYRHRLPMTDEIRNGLCGYGDKEGLDEQISAVERGLSKVRLWNGEQPTCLWMVHEDTWQRLQEVDFERWGPTMKSVGEDLKREYASLPADDPSRKWALRLLLEKMFRNNAAMTEAFCWAHDEGRFDEMVDEAVELYNVQLAMGATRRYFGPAAGSGGQNTDWEAHKAIAELVLRRVERGIEEEAPDWDEDEEEEYGEE